MPRNPLTKSLKDSVEATRRAIDKVLDTLGEFEEDGRTFISDTFDETQDVVVGTKNTAKDFATTSRTKAKSFTEDTRNELASYAAEVRDDAGDLAVDARKTAITAVGDVKTRTVDASHSALRQVRKGSDRIRTTGSSSRSDEIVELRAAVTQLTELVTELSAAANGRATAKK